VSRFTESVPFTVFMYVSPRNDPDASSVSQSTRSANDIYKQALS